MEMLELFAEMPFFEGINSRTKAQVTSLLMTATTTPPRMPKSAKMSWKQLPIEIKLRIIELFLEDVLAGLKMIPGKLSHGSYNDLDMILLGLKPSGPRQFCIGCCPGRLFTLGRLNEGERLVIQYDKNRLQQPTIAHLKSQLKCAVLPMASSSLDSIQPVLVDVAAHMLCVRIKSLGRSITWRPSGCAWTKVELECEVLNNLTSKKKVAMMIRNAKQLEMSNALYPQLVGQEPRLVSHAVVNTDMNFIGALCERMMLVSHAVVNTDIDFIRAFCKRMIWKTSWSIRRRRGMPTLQMQTLELLER